MKTNLCAILAAAAVLSGAGAAFGAAGGVPKATATVAFLESENFTDFQLSHMGGRSEQESLEAELTKHVERLAEMYLPAGSRLTLRFRDIDMAGDFEPFRTGGFGDVRIMRSIYAPRLHIEYSVTNPDGTVAASGERKLSDNAYQWKLRVRSLSMSSTEIEAELLGDFLRELGRAGR